MHTDRKIGFAMGILLVGIVAALFFRNEPLLSTRVSGVRREQELNERLRVPGWVDDGGFATLLIADDVRSDGEAGDESLVQEHDFLLSGKGCGANSCRRQAADHDCQNDDEPTEHFRKGVPRRASAHFGEFWQLGMTCALC